MPQGNDFPLDSLDRRPVDTSTIPVYRSGVPQKKKGPVLTQLVDGKECVSVSEAARIRGVSRQAIWVRVQRGTLPHFLIADRIYIPIEALGA